MKPYFESLHVDDTEFLPAVHWQKRFVPRDQACYTCHTTYTMFGGLKAKLTGLKHMWVNYFGEIPEKLELYEPYNDRACLHCHGGARIFEEREQHREVMGELASGEINCRECHEKIHPVHELDSHEKWYPEQGIREAAGGDGR